MVGLFPPAGGNCRLLDAGAGIGSLSAAFLERWASGGFDFGSVELDAFEIDDALHRDLIQTFARYHRSNFFPTVRRTDFIHAATDWLSGSLFAESFLKYTHAILNPPYKKINSNSAYRLALRRAGIETVNLYSAFVALAVALGAPGCQIVAIIPRSFCNGPYYRPFRDFILARTTLRHMHLFESRSKAFKDDEVLQENVIIRLECGGRQGLVTISTSTDDNFNDLAVHEHPFDRVVFPGDSERFIHVPTSPEQDGVELPAKLRHSLDDLGIKVSTGPVVDFRLKKHLRQMPEPGTVPLLYPGHFTGNGATWPLEGIKKPNAIVRNAETAKWFYPSGYYCVVRRFSSKEEKRRIVASVVDPSAIDNAPVIGFENHLNVFHENKHGLPHELAHGLAVFLSTTSVDKIFRRFNGHTQVNAADLKLIKYPSREILTALGRWAMQQGELTQKIIDGKVEAMIA